MSYFMVDRRDRIAQAVTADYVPPKSDRFVKVEADNYSEAFQKAGLGSETQCDFCNVRNPDPNHTLTCQSFAVDVTGTLAGIPITSSAGDWLACETCYQLIRGGRWDDLARRSAETFLTENPGMGDFNEIYDFMLTMHSQFRRMYYQTQ